MEPVRRRLAEELLGLEPDPEHPGEGRTPLAALREGQELTGTVTDCWLYHGAEIDVGAEYDGLLPIAEAQWLALREALAPGTRVTVRVHAVRKPGMHRWPLQLAIVEPDVQAQIIHPDEWYCPLDLGWAFDQTKDGDFEEAMGVLERPYTIASYYPDRDVGQLSSNLQYAFGWDESDIHAQPDDWIERAARDPRATAAAAAAVDAISGGA